MLKKFTLFLIILLLFWISFFPQPIQDKYGIALKIFLGIFLLVLLFSRKIFQNFRLFVKDWPLWLFLACILPNIFLAQDKKIALDTYLHLSLCLCLLFYIGKGLYNQRNADFAHIVICICSGLVAIFGLFEVIFAFNPLYKYFISNPFYERYITSWVRPMSTLFNPAPLASYLLVGLPSAVYIFKSKTLIKKTCGAVVLVINCVCLILTFCRSSFLGLLAMLFFFLLIQKQYKKTLLFVLAASILFLLMSVLPYPFNRLSPKGIGIYGTGVFSDYRITRTKMAVNMLKTSPLTGVGLKNFRVLFDKYYPNQNELLYVDYEIKIADNMYLTLLAETGILGLGGFLIFVFMLLRRVIKKTRKAGGSISNQIFLYPGLSLIGLFFSMVGYELFYWYTPYALFCLTCGFIQGAVYDGGI